LFKFVPIIYRNSVVESEKLGNEINALLVKIAQQRKSILKAKAKNCKHKLLENPFFIYYSTADNLLSVAETIDELIKIHSDISIDTFDLWEKKSDLYRSAFLMLLSSFEGFLNILYELYLKTELRTDRLYERISREQVDINLGLLQSIATASIPKLSTMRTKGLKITCGW